MARKVPREAPAAERHQPSCAISNRKGDVYQPIQVRCGQSESNLKGLLKDEQQGLLQEFAAAEGIVVIYQQHAQEADRCAHPAGDLRAIAVRVNSRDYLREQHAAGGVLE